MEHHAAQQLHVKVPHVDGAYRGLTDGCKRFDHDVVERRAVFQAFAKQRGLTAQLLVRHRLELRLHIIDLFNVRLQLFQPACACVAKQCIQ